MAGHPLRPATRRRLGGPSPPQQADRPRAPPRPKNFPPAPMRGQVLSGINPRFRRLSQSQGQVAHVLLTRSPLGARRHLVRLACVKHAASVRPEPGSNSPLKSVDARSTRGPAGSSTHWSIPARVVLTGEPVIDVVLPKESVDRYRDQTEVFSRNLPTGRYKLIRRLLAHC